MPQSTALLNWASQYNTISPFLSSIAGSTDWLRIFISPDTAGGGHFITHGIDFGASYAGGLRGLVPANGGTLNKTYLRGDGWSALWTAADEVASAVGDTAAQQEAAKELYLQTTLASVYDIKSWITQAFVANNAMRFKGTITIDNLGNMTNTTDAGTVSGFPTACEVGDTYKVNGNSVDSNSYITGEPVSTGDMVICIKSGSGASLNDSQYWTVVQDNVEHLISLTLNNSIFRIYAQTSQNITFYAPSTSGSTGQILTSGGTGNEPTWVNAVNVTVGTANKVSNALTAGAGIIMLSGANAASSYDGSAAITIKLSPATTSVIGGVLIDDGTNSEKYNQITNVNNDPYPTITVDANGQIYLTKQNIVNALGYDPVSALPIFTNALDGLVPMSSAANKQHNDNGTDVDNILTAATYVLGEDAKWYRLPSSAFQSDRRIVQLNGTTVIAADSGNALNIFTGDHINIIPELNQSNEYTGKVTFEAIWRDIQVHLVSGSTIGSNVSSIGDDDPLVFDNTDTVFMLGESVQVGSGANATHKTVIKSYITWYNMDTGEYEII